MRTTPTPWPLASLTAVAGGLDAIGWGGGREVECVVSLQCKSVQDTAGEACDQGGVGCHGDILNEAGVGALADQDQVPSSHGDHVPRDHNAIGCGESYHTCDWCQACEWRRREGEEGRLGGKGRREERDVRIERNGGKGEGGRYYMKLSI